MSGMNRELLKRVLNARTIGYPLPPSIVKEIEAELARPEPPAQQKPLSNDEIQDIIGIPKDYKAFYEVVKAVEAHHGIK